MYPRKYKQFQRAESMQWDVAVDHTHQSRAEAQKRLSVQRKLAFLVFQGKKSFSASVPAHLTWISIFSGALTKHCIGIRKIHSNIGFSWLPWRLFQIKSLFGWFMGWFFPSSRQGLLHLSFPQGKGEQERLRGWHREEGTGNTKSSTANQMWPQRKKRAVSELDVPFGRALGMLWNSRISLHTEETPTGFPAGSAPFGAVLSDVSARTIRYYQVIKSLQHRPWTVFAQKSPEELQWFLSLGLSVINSIRTLCISM